jgi:hypothetical protein
MYLTQLLLGWVWWMTYCSFLRIHTIPCEHVSSDHCANPRSTNCIRDRWCVPWHMPRLASVQNYSSLEVKNTLGWQKDFLNCYAFSLPLFEWWQKPSHFLQSLSPKGHLDSPASTQPQAVALTFTNEINIMNCEIKKLGSNTSSNSSFLPLWHKWTS